MIFIKSQAEVQKIRRAGQIVAEALDAVTAAVRPGISTAELDRIAYEVIRGAGARPSFKNYKPFENAPAYPATICASINEELVHGIPSPRRILREGDIISIDVGAVLDGYHGDAAVTVPVGAIPASTRRLLDVTQESLYAGIRAARGGQRLGDVSAAIQQVIEAAGYGVVQGYGGHGVGRRLHEDPHVPNHGTPGKGLILKPGMTLALEPMANEGTPATTVRPDKWTVATADGRLCAHFEHTIGITESQALILTDFPAALYERIGRSATATA